ncbi:IS30 family transposase [Nocardioides sp. NPDC087217]|uniref:IS30 family transposase n=1 Tax=Nocardioides sp. NPDC087217 TaxID=3364335 RepID=UPI00381FA09F
MPKVFAAEVRIRVVDLICAGSTARGAADVVGVSKPTAVQWWHQACPVLIPLEPGALRGGLGAALPCDPGVDSPGRQRRCLTGQDRAVIAAGLADEWSQAKIAAAIGRDRSVVCREVARNTGSDGVYRAELAHRAAHQRRRRPKEFKLAVNPQLCRLIEDWMDQGWSPGLIAMVLRTDHPGVGSGVDPAARMAWVSHETIYRALYVQTRGQLRADLHRCLSTRRKARKPRGRASHDPSKNAYIEAFKISQRPAEVADRVVPGHWEGDLILGTKNGSAIGTLVERSTRFVILLHLPTRHDAETVAEAMIREMGKLPEHLRRSITWDRGLELARYQDIQIQLGTTVYFADPHSPWQRGSNENTNRLLRHWFEKSSDLSRHSAEDLHRVADTLNRRPRPTLDLQTPAQRLAQLLNPAA